MVRMAEDNVILLLSVWYGTIHTTIGRHYHTIHPMASSEKRRWKRATLDCEYFILIEKTVKVYDIFVFMFI